MSNLGPLPETTDAPPPSIAAPAPAATPPLAQPFTNTMGQFADIGMFPESATPPSALAGAQAAPGGAGLVDDGSGEAQRLIREAASLRGQGKQALAQESQGIADYQAAENQRLEAKFMVETAQRQAEADAKRDAAEGMRNEVTAQNMYRDEWAKRRAELDTRLKTHNQQLDAHLAASHPTDIWTASGVPPVAGAIALFLGTVGTFRGGANTALEVIKMRADLRASQLRAEGQALDMEGSQLHQMMKDADSLYGDQRAGSESMQSAILRSSMAQIDVIANKYASPNARLASVELKNKLFLESMKLQNSATQKAIDNAGKALQADTDAVKLLSAASGKNALVNKATEAKLDSSLGFAGTALHYWEMLRDSKSTNTNPMTRAAYAQEMLANGAMARNIPGGSLSRYLPKEYTGAGIADPLGAVLPLGKDKHGSAVIVSQKAFDMYGRSVVARLWAQAALNPAYGEKVRKAGIPTLQEFDRKHGLSEGTGLYGPTDLADESTYQADKAQGAVD